MAVLGNGHTDNRYVRLAAAGSKALILAAPQVVTVHAARVRVGDEDNLRIRSSSDIHGPDQRVFHRPDHDTDHRAPETLTNLEVVAGSYTAYKTDKIATDIFPIQDGKTIRAPIVKEGVLAVECKVVQMTEIEGRYIFIGEAKYAEFSDNKKPLLYHAGKYFSIGDQIPKPDVKIDV